jgi:hypothetical protein
MWGQDVRAVQGTAQLHQAAAATFQLSPWVLLPVALLLLLLLLVVLVVLWLLPGHRPQVPPSPTTTSMWVGCACWMAWNNTTILVQQRLQSSCQAVQPRALLTWQQEGSGLMTLPVSAVSAAVPAGTTWSPSLWMSLL